jgi:hypothetical protein
MNTISYDKSSNFINAGHGAQFLNNKAKESSMTDNISPELAAQIVKHYILPMFESDEKKNLKNKYNKLSSIANK